jgi:hypothetical protein
VIGLCGFGYRFNSFYRDEIHPFAQEMGAALIEAGKRANRPLIENYLRRGSAEELQKNIQSMWKLCDELVAERKRNPQPGARDLLDTMLSASDPQTGERLSDENIRFNMVTFLVRCQRLPKSGIPTWVLIFGIRRLDTRRQVALCHFFSISCSRTRRPTTKPRKKSTELLGMVY